MSRLCASIIDGLSAQQAQAVQRVTATGRVYNLQRGAGCRSGQRIPHQTIGKLATITIVVGPRACTNHICTTHVACVPASTLT